MTPVVLAHAGHWAVSLLYIAPVVIVVGWLSFSSWRDSRRRKDEEPG